MGKGVKEDMVMELWLVLRQRNFLKTNPRGPAVQ